jgi:Domain of unknown function (DUF4252)
MKPLIIIACMLLGMSSIATAQDRWLYWKYKDYDKGINFIVPRFAIMPGSLFLKNKEERQLMRRVHKVRMLIFEDGTPISNRDIRRFDRKARRRGLEDIIFVRDGQTRVKIMAKERRGILRKAVVFVNSPDDGFFMISIKGRLKMKDINEVIKRARKQQGEEDNPLPKIPEVLRA